ncbi:hypothetical protein [Salinigranum halophilum]|jgi:hypothetical protein|uniref:hypothetical protein n=1 Tax=Salinigranum halophilum TaxID=2565931 RepID=UPI0010A7B2C7|nr:hypothetical protein [Salinigranum halophilum]
MDETVEAAESTSGGRAGLDRTALGYALLFSVPVWVGITVMMLKVTGGRPLALVLAPGLVVGGAVFAFVVLATRGGYATE